MNFFYLALFIAFLLSCNTEKRSSKNTPCYSINISVEDSLKYYNYKEGLKYSGYFHKVDIIDREPTFLSQLANKKLEDPIEILSKEINLDDAIGVRKSVIKADKISGLILSFGQPDMAISSVDILIKTLGKKEISDGVALLDGEKYFVPINDVEIFSSNVKDFQKISIYIDVNEPWIDKLKIDSNLIISLKYDYDSKVLIDKSFSLTGKGVNYILSYKNWYDSNFN